MPGRVLFFNKTRDFRALQPLATALWGTLHILCMDSSLPNWVKGNLKVFRNIFMGSKGGPGHSYCRKLLKKTKCTQGPWVLGGWGSGHRQLSSGVDPEVTEVKRNRL